MRAAAKQMRGRGGAPGRNRTCGLEVRNLTLYPLSYGRKTYPREMERPAGLEPAISSMASWRSTN